ncbi:hypothetical protein [Photobacterium nomapromontoriensis]|uniref:hypothetical protein n=1 Tax=Photobacterium nomapromontoriensis TaxID=2910237 RepID=UPI003D0D229A
MIKIKKLSSTTAYWLIKIAIFLGISAVAIVNVVWFLSYMFSDDLNFKLMFEKDLLTFILGDVLYFTLIVFWLKVLARLSSVSIYSDYIDIDGDKFPLIMVSEIREISLSTVFICKFSINDKSYYFLPYSCKGHPLSAWFKYSCNLKHKNIIEFKEIVDRKRSAEK